MKTSLSGSGKGIFRDGRWEVNNLDFLVQFMAETAMTTADIADRMGLARQTVYHWLVKDDIKVSSVYHLFNTCGYRVKFNLESPKNTRGNADVIFNIENPDESENLGFLSIAMRKNRISKKALSEITGFGETSVHYWFRNDDCNLSRIYEIADAYGLNLRIEISKID